MDKDHYVSTEYNIPLIENRADPYICKHEDGTYYFTASVPEYDRIIRAADEVRSQYESQFGPLCSFRSYAGGQWKWIDNPWPWTSCANPDMEKESC